MGRFCGGAVPRQRAGPGELLAAVWHCVALPESPHPVPSPQLGCRHGLDSARVHRCRGGGEAPAPRQPAAAGSGGRPGQLLRGRGRRGGAAGAHRAARAPARRVRRGPVSPPHGDSGSGAGKGAGGSIWSIG